MPPRAAPRASNPAASRSPRAAAAKPRAAVATTPPRAAAKPRAAPLPRRATWGGRRPGAGRKPKAGRPGVPHLARPRLEPTHPLHVTLKLRKGLPNLRTRRLGRLLFAAFAKARERFGMRLVHFSIQHNHLHLIVEAASKRALSRALQGFAIRIAKRLNARLRRSGPVFADRYHARALPNPLQVRRAVRYVLNNYRRHHGRSAAKPPRDWADPFTSADYFDGFLPLPSGRIPRCEIALGRDPPVAPPRTWLLRIGWKRLGLLRLTDIPGPAPGAPAPPVAR